MLLQLATTKFCCVAMFEVGGNTCNNAFQLAKQQCCVKVEGKCCPYYRAFNSPCFHTSMHFTGGSPFYALASCLRKARITKNNEFSLLRRIFRLVMHAIWQCGHGVMTSVMKRPSTFSRKE